MNKKPMIVTIFLWVEMILAARVLLFTIPVLISKNLMNTMSSINAQDWFILTATIISLMFFVVALSSVLGHKLWKIFHLVALVTSLLLTLGLVNRVMVVNEPVAMIYLAPFIVALFFTVVVILSARKVGSSQKAKWKSILIVDDDELVIKTIRPVLMSHGYSVLTAINGEDGLYIVKHQKPDLVILDVILPGIKGRDVCKLIKEDKATQDIPVIFLTSKDSKDDIEAEMQAGGQEHITKPVNTKELLASVNKILEAK